MRKMMSYDTQKKNSSVKKLCYLALRRGKCNMQRKSFSQATMRHQDLTILQNTLKCSQQNFLDNDGS